MEPKVLNSQIHWSRRFLREDMESHNHNGLLEMECIQHHRNHDPRLRGLLLDVFDHARYIHFEYIRMNNNVENSKGKKSWS